MPRWPLGILALSALVPSLLLHRAASAGLDPDGAEARQAALQQMKHDVLWESALAEAREASEARTDRARAARRSRLGRATGSGARGRLAPRLAAGSGATLLAPADVLVNDNASDALLDICNAEVALAADGAFLLAAWNDGAGNDQQGWATSMNGGATWIDGGAMPALPAGWRWRADPTLATAPSHGKVYYCGLADSSGASNAIGLAIYDVVNGGWLPPSFVRREPSAQTILDKEWIA